MDASGRLGKSNLFNISPRINSCSFVERISGVLMSVWLSSNCLKPNTVFHLFHPSRGVCVRQYADIRSEGRNQLFFRDGSIPKCSDLRSKSLKHPAAGFCADEAMVPKKDIAEEINALMQLPYGNLFRMQSEREAVIQEP